MKPTTAASSLARTVRLMKIGVRSGFTLVELLVVITIIATLAALIFSLSSHMINSAEKAVCVSNFRSIGGAIQMYAVDNNSRLPGPLFQGQYAKFTGDYNGSPAGDSKALVTYIAQYLQGSMSRPKSGSSRVENFGCPSLLKRAPKASSNPVVYRMEGNYLLKKNGGDPAQQKPWGYPDSDQVPWRTDQIDPLSAGKVVGMIEQDDTMQPTPVGWYAGATGPAHGNQRMAMYFDWSVKALNAKEDWKK